MFISKRRLNELIEKATNDAREELIMNERFNDIYRMIDSEYHKLRSELDALRRDIEAMDQTKKNKK